MFKNIGKTVRVLSIVLAALSFLGFAALGTLSLLAAMEAGISKELETAGMQAAIICYALAVLTPFLNLILFGFGTLITAAQEQAQDSKKAREMLQAALSDGMLSEEIARKSAQAQSKLLEHLLSKMPASEKAPKKPSHAPVQRPVKEITPPAAPAQEAPVQVSPAQMTEQEPNAQPAPAFIPMAQASAQQPAQQPPTQQAPAFAPMPPMGTPFRSPAPAVSGEADDFLKPLSGNEETF